MNIAKPGVGFDTSRRPKHAVAIAESGRGGEVRFLGDVASSPARVERLARKLRSATTSCISATRMGSFRRAVRLC